MKGMIQKAINVFKEDWAVFKAIRADRRLTNAQAFALLISTYRKAEEASK